jgi:hypothetical protein
MTASCGSSFLVHDTNPDPITALSRGYLRASLPQVWMLNINPQPCRQPWRRLCGPWLRSCVIVPPVQFKLCACACACVCERESARARERERCSRSTPRQTHVCRGGLWMCLFIYSDVCWFMYSDACVFMYSGPHSAHVWGLVSGVASHALVRELLLVVHAFAIRLLVHCFTWFYWFTALLGFTALLQHTLDLLVVDVFGIRLLPRLRHVNVVVRVY